VIRGRILDRQARVNVTFVLDGRPDVTVECVVDTGFEGTVILPARAVALLDLPFVTDLAANLADGRDVRVDVHVATIMWDDVPRRVAVLAMGHRPLIGTSLLNGCHLEMDFIEGANVLIDPL
jgi:clan AA aspartic protease